jgi:hypothetical protein
MIIVIASILILAALGLVVYERQRSRRLKDRFGPAYDQTVSEIGNRRRAEARLERREARVSELRERVLDPSDREKFLARWKKCQAQFVDDPAGAVDEADALLAQIMRTRGYSADNPTEQLTDIAAAYPQHVERYRQACQIIERHRRTPGSTDDLRAAFLYYRSLFDDLIGGHDEKLRRAS